MTPVFSVVWYVQSISDETFEVQGKTQKLRVKFELKTGLIQTISTKIHIKAVHRA